MTSAALLLEAQAEFDEWDASAKTLACHFGSRVYVKHFKAKKLKCDCGKRAVRNGMCSVCRVKERTTRYNPCACGRPYFAKGLCRSCYYKIINRRRRRERPKVHGQCKCGKAATRLCGLCNSCYRKTLPKSPRKNLARTLRNLMLRWEKESLQRELTAQEQRNRMRLMQ